MKEHNSLKKITVALLVGAGIICTWVMFHKNESNESFEEFLHFIAKYNKIMNLQTYEVINFSTICKQNNLQFPSERFSDLINYLNIHDF